MPHTCAPQRERIACSNPAPKSTTRAGRVVRTITLADALGVSGEGFVQATGAAGGVYALLRGDGGGRVVFVPA